MVGGVGTSDLWIFDIKNKSWKELVSIKLYCVCGLEFWVKFMVLDKLLSQILITLHVHL